MPSALNLTRATRSAAAPMLALLPLPIKGVLWRYWSLQSFRTRWQHYQQKLQNVGYKQEVAAWDEPPNDSDNNADDEDDEASRIKMMQRLMR